MTFGALRRLPTKKLRAFAYRHMAQPLVERMDAELVVNAVGGVSMIADLSDPSGRALVTTGLWEWNVGAAIQQALEPGDVFVDVGANSGYYAALAARIVGSSGHVYALEPAPRTFRKLERNLSLNGLTNVTALAIAAGAAEGEATLFGPASGHDATSSLRHRPPAASSTTVPVRRLDTVIAPEHHVRLKLVKVDVEGHEDDVLRGLEPLFDEGARPQLLVEVHVSYNEEAPGFVAGLCERHGLRAHWLVEDEGIDDHLAPADRQLVLRDVGSPPDLTSVARDRYAVFLTADLSSSTGSSDRQAPLPFDAR